MQGWYNARYHYYEAGNAFIRYQSRAMANRCMQLVAYSRKRQHAEHHIELLGAHRIIHGLTVRAGR